ncbi:MAG: hypothetical protein V1702_03730 [Candidatus Woesearchaeota archaeon]
MEFPRIWERINNTTSRLQVLGGWLVEVIEENGMDMVSDAWRISAATMVFVPDPKYEWKLEPEKMIKK